MNEFHIYGPPGTGKTTTLTKNISIAAGKHGTEKVMVSSFTRAAATEVIDRGADVAKHMIGTLHSICFRALQEPAIAEMNVAEFNADASHPYRLAAHSIDLNEASDTGTTRASGDDVMAHYQSLRARMVPRAAWGVVVPAFAKHWEEFKKTNDLLDFNDLIEIARDEFDVAPGNPKVMFVDEAQDLNALQFSCIRKWGESMERLVLVGDDDQSIYDFSGADAGNMLDRGIPEQNKIILRRSYRVPRAVLALADKWIRRLSHRQEKEYEPRDADGEVRRMTMATWKNPDDLISDIRSQHADGKTIMILAACGYMLPPIINLLRDAGFLFHNPYRVTNGFWNPVRTGEGSTLNRCLTFLRGDLDPHWTNSEFHRWTELIRAKGLLKHGSKKAIQDLATESPHAPVEMAAVRQFFEGPGPWDSLDPWSGRDAELLSWLFENAIPGKRKTVSYVKNIVKSGRKEDLHLKPKITVGTIHSVKGGEADVVYLFPDVSRDAYDGWSSGGKPRDAVIRTMYVGVTRARESLIIAGNAGPLAVDL